jgi:hypothetical protein
MSIVAGRRLGKHVPAARDTRNNRRIVGRVVFYIVRAVSKKSKRLVLPKMSCYLRTPESTRVYNSGLVEGKVTG